MYIEQQAPSTTPQPQPPQQPLPPQQPPQRTARLPYCLAMAAVVGVAVAVALTATRWGLATSSDSARYLRMARDMLHPDAPVDPDEPKHLQAHFPPGYPAALALVGAIGGDPLPAGRWLHTALLAANALLAGVLVQRFGGETWAAALAALLVVIVPGSIVMHAFALSEPLFMLLAMCTLGLLAAHLDRPRWSVLCAAAVMAALGMMTRYAGAALVPAGAAAIVLLSDRPRRRRLGEAAAFTAIAILPPALWAIRNVLASGTATNRAITFHPLSKAHLMEAGSAVAGWLSPVEPPSVVLRVIASAVFIALPLLALDVRFRRRQPASQLNGVLMLFMVSFVALLVVSISFVDFHTPADSRVLSPLLVAWVVLAGTVASAAAARWETRRLWLQLGGAALVVVVAWPSGKILYNLWQDGGGYSDREWRESPTIAAVRDLPPDLRVYTNLSPAMYLLTGRPMISMVPTQTIPSSKQPNPKYRSTLSRIRKDLRAGTAVLVYLDRIGARRRYYATEAELKQELGLRIRASFPDGTIYDSGQAITKRRAAAERRRRATNPSTTTNAAIE